MLRCCGPLLGLFGHQGTELDRSFLLAFQSLAHYCETFIRLYFQYLLFLFMGEVFFFGDSLGFTFTEQQAIDHRGWLVTSGALTQDRETLILDDLVDYLLLSRHRSILHGFGGTGLGSL